MTQPLSAPLPNFGYELNGIRFGRDTDYHVSSFNFGDSPIISNDAPLPRTDGIRFGRDYRGGQLITIEGNVLTTRSHPGDSSAAFEAKNALSAAWDPEELRLTPGAVIPLRMNRAGRIRRVYGRPRRFTTVTGSGTRGRIPFACDFQCTDNLFYDDVELSRTVPIIPAEFGGLEGDLIGDLISLSDGVGQIGIQVGGNRSAWLITRIFGPIIGPDIEVVGQWRYKLNTSLAYDDSVLVNPTPWTRSTRREIDGANLSGAFTATSIRLSAQKVAPGNHQVILRGIDPTGSSRAEVFWRDTYSSD